VKIANVPSEWSEAYLRDFLSAQEVVGLQFCTMLAPKAGLNTCTSILKFNPAHHAELAMNLIPTLSFKNSQGAFINLEVIHSSPAARPAELPLGGGAAYQHRSPSGFHGPGSNVPPPSQLSGQPKTSPYQPGSIPSTYDNRNLFGNSPHHVNMNNNGSSGHGGMPSSESGAAAAAGETTERWCSDDLMNYLEQATSQIRDNLAKGMIPSAAQLEKYVQKLVDRMQMKMKGAPFAIWDTASQLFFPFWGFVSNSRIRDPSTEELSQVLEKLLTEVVPHNTTLNHSGPPPQQQHSHPGSVAGAPAPKRMRYDY